MWVIIYMEENLNYSIFNPRDKLSERKEEINERKEELLNKRKEIKQELKLLYKEKTFELKRQMQIVKTKNWKVKNPELLKIQKHRRYLWLKESNRLRNILLE